MKASHHNHRRRLGVIAKAAVVRQNAVMAGLSLRLAANVPWPAWKGLLPGDFFCARPAAAPGLRMYLYADTVFFRDWLDVLNSGFDLRTGGFFFLDPRRTLLLIPQPGLLWVMDFASDAVYFVVCNGTDFSGLSLFVKNSLFFWTHKFGVFQLHASAVQGPRGGYVFLGPSGSGKTTIAARLKTAGFSTVHDDSVAVRRSGGGFRVYPLPCPTYCSDRMTARRGVALRACFRLVKSRSERLTPLSKAELFSVLFGGWVVPPTLYRKLDDAAARLTFFYSLLEGLTASVPGYDLHFSLSGAPQKLLKGV